VTDQQSTAPVTNVRIAAQLGLGRITAVFAWLAGIVLATGKLAWLAAFCPPYAWYLAVEAVMRKLGLAP
jgi:hypothetical protein